MDSSQWTGDLRKDYEKGSYLFKTKGSPAIVNDSWCCGARTMGGFAVAWWMHDTLHQVTVDQAAEAIQMCRDKYGPMRGGTMAITNPAQEKAWGPALERHGFTVLKKFRNPSTSNTLILRILLSHPITE